MLVSGVCPVKVYFERIVKVTSSVWLTNFDVSSYFERLVSVNRLQRNELYLWLRSQATTVLRAALARVTCASKAKPLMQVPIWNCASKNRTFRHSVEDSAILSLRRTVAI